MFSTKFLNLSIWICLCLLENVSVGFADQLPVKLLRQFPSKEYPLSNFSSISRASPVLDRSRSQPSVIVSVQDGKLLFLNIKTGQLEDQVTVPESPEYRALIVATPVFFENNLIVVYQSRGKKGRERHRVVVIDLIKRKINADYPILELSAQVKQADGQGVINFDPIYAYSHAELKHIKPKGTENGLAYVAFGNAGDIQPYHGWLFELDLDAWKKLGADHAISHVFLTTPESECDVTVTAGTREMICAGGIWTPAGPQIYATAEGYEILVPTGNGQLDLNRKDYANSLLRLKPGLNFDPQCNEQLCKDFDAVKPDLACIESCKNLFIPRLLPGNKPIKPITGECDKRTFLDCLAWMDYDLGANSPVKINLKNGKSVVVQASKEGAVYLLDGDHFGTVYDRKQLVETCGTKEDPCRLSWRGMMVTHPVVSATNSGDQIVVVPTYVLDHSHDAGLFALKIDISGEKPVFKQVWQFPNPSSSDALKSFRGQPSLPIITRLKKHGDVVWIVDINKQGTLYGIRINDGRLIAKTKLIGAGISLARPVFYKNTLYFTSSHFGEKTTWLEAYKIQE